MGTKIIDEAELALFASAAQRFFQHTTTPAVSVPPAPTPTPAAAPAPIQPTAATARIKIAWGARVSDTFRDRVWWIADTITASQGQRFDPNWLMACMAWESAESFAPDKQNMAGSGAVGLIQFMPSTAQALGTTTAALAAMTAEDQLNYVYKYFADAVRHHGPITTIDDCYMVILWPSAIGKPASYGLFDRSAKPTTYRQNAGLDVNRDGVVTKFEAAAHVREKLDKGMALAA